MPSLPERRAAAASAATGRFVAFYTLACALSWACWIPAALHPGSSRALLLAGGLGPLAATAIVLSPRSQRAERDRWWRRLAGVRAMVSPAGAMSILGPLLLASLALASWQLGDGIDLPGAGAGEFARLLVPVVLLGALPQELAWRGYALPLLIRGRDPVAPTLLLGLGWALWQLPLFFVAGTWQATIPAVSVPGLLFLVDVLAQSLLLTALYLATRCTWAAVAFQGGTLLAGEYWQLPLAAELHRWLWTVVLAGLVLLLRPPFGACSGAGGEGTRR